MKNIKELREFLGETMKDLRAGKIDVEKAKAISDLGQVLVNSAKTEVDFLKVTKIETTDFISDGIVKSKKQLENKGGDNGERPKAEYSNNGHQSLLDKYNSQ